MNGYIVYCNACYESILFSSSTSNSHPQHRHNHNYYLTTCGKIFCQNCHSLQTLCTKCGPKCLKKLITNQMGFELEMFFKDYDYLVKQLYLVHEFQINRYQTIIKYLLQQNIQVEQKVEEKNQHARVLRDEIVQLDQEIQDLKHQARTQKSNQLRIKDCCDPKEIPFMDTVIQAVENEVNNQNNITFMSDQPFSSRSIPGSRINFNPNHSAGSSSLGNLSQTRNRFGKGSIIGRAYPMQQLRQSVPIENNNGSGSRINYRESNVQRFLDTSFSTQFRKFIQGSNKSIYPM